MDAQELARLLRFVRKYKGYAYLAMAVELCQSHSVDAGRFCQTVYGSIAEFYAVSPSSVEYNLRTVIKKLSGRSPELIAELTGEELPGNAAFVLALAALLNEEERKQILPF